MAIRVVKFSWKGYKIRYSFDQKLSKEIIVFLSKEVVPKLSKSVKKTDFQVHLLEKKLGAIFCQLQFSKHLVFENIAQFLTT